MTDPTTDPTTLYIRVGNRKQLYRDAERRLKEEDEKEESGEDVSDRHILNIEDPADLGRVLSRVNLDLLRALQEESPSSISAAAEAVGRDYKEVHRNLTELAALNIIRLEDEGRSKKPILPYDQITVDVPLDAGGRESDEHTVT